MLIHFVLALWYGVVYPASDTHNKGSDSQSFQVNLTDSQVNKLIDMTDILDIISMHLAR